MSTEKKKGIWLECQNCHRRWQWTGDPEKSPYASCSHCHFKVNVAKRQIQEPIQKG